MSDLVQEAARTVAETYLAGVARPGLAAVASAIRVRRVELGRVVRRQFGSFEKFVKTVVPGGTRTLQCEYCTGVIQANAKDSRASSCVPCRLLSARLLLAGMVRRGECIELRALLDHPEIRWIPTQAHILWGKPYALVLNEEFPERLKVKGSVEERQRRARRASERFSRVIDPMRNSVRGAGAVGEEGVGIGPWGGKYGWGLPARQDTAARNKLVKDNIGLVHFFVDKFMARRPITGVSREELAQEAAIGLMRAAELFDDEKGTKFSTYAAWWIRQKIERAWQDHNFSIRLPSKYTPNVAELLNAAQATPSGNSGCDTGSVSQRIGAKIAADARLLDKIHERLCIWRAMTVASLSGTNADGDSRESDVQYVEPGFSAVEDKVDFALVRERFAGFARRRSIPEIEIGIFCRRVFDDQSFFDLALQYNLSRERVRQLYHKTCAWFKDVYPRFSEIEGQAT